MSDNTDTHRAPVTSYKPLGRYRVIRYDRDMGELAEQWADTIDATIDHVRRELVLACAEDEHSITVDVFE